jgi:hypothetical protein
MKSIHHAAHYKKSSFLFLLKFFLSFVCFVFFLFLFFSKNNKKNYKFSQNKKIHTFFSISF